MTFLSHIKSKNRFRFWSRTGLIQLISLIGLLQFGYAGSFYEQKVRSINGAPYLLSSLKGKPVLLVNIATRCGFTPQLKDLEALYKKYQSRGLVVLGMPSNDFGGQTPEAPLKVKRFCERNYGVSFPLLEKAKVSGSKKHPLIQTLIAQADSQDEIGWNFEKFLISPSGQVVGRYSSSTAPLDSPLEKKIKSLLK